MQQESQESHSTQVLAMKIAVIGPQFVDSFAHNVAFTLETMGHEVAVHHGTLRRHDRSRFNAAFWDRAASSFTFLTSRLHDSLLKTLSNFQPEMVLVTHDLFTPEALEKFRSV